MGHFSDLAIEEEPGRPDPDAALKERLRVHLEKFVAEKAAQFKRHAERRRCDDGKEEEAAS
jgi:hypothetical protein